MSFFIRSLLPDSPWLIAVLDGDRKALKTFEPTSRDREIASTIVECNRASGKQVRVLAGKTKTSLSRAPEMSDLEWVCAIGVRLPLAVKDGLPKMENAPAHYFVEPDPKFPKHPVVAVWRFEKSVSPRDAAKAEQALASQLGGERLNFFMPVPANNMRQKFGYERIEPKDVVGMKLVAARISHANPIVNKQAQALMDVLSDYGFEGNIKGIKGGPVITLYEVELKRGTLANKIAERSEDIARDMGAQSARVITNYAQRTIGIELPNANRETVALRQLVASPAFQKSDAALPLILGKGITGEPLVVDLATMPHLLIAGTTGSGKSVGLNGMILSLLKRYSPDECKFIMIDPKVVELSVYKGIPHLYSRVITDVEGAIATLKGVVGVMKERYAELERAGAKNISSYRAKTGASMPYIVVVIDEIADLMADPKDRKEVEIAVQRLSQMARAAGIHLIVATQRPSVDVITGTIKSNLPTRISFQMASGTDSRTVLGEQGAEQLLGKGDMLFQATGGKLTRAHGAYVSEEEIEAEVARVKKLGAPEYVDFTLCEAPSSVKPTYSLISENAQSTKQPPRRKLSSTVHEYAAALQAIFTPGGQPITGVEVRKTITQAPWYLTWGQSVYDAADVLRIERGAKVGGWTGTKPWMPPPEWPEEFAVN